MRVLLARAIECVVRLSLFERGFESEPSKITDPISARSPEAVQFSNLLC
jgi:hypothetical protein